MWLKPLTARDAEVFTDIGENIHRDDILYIAGRGLTVGCDRNGPRYCPDRPVNRAEMAVFLARALRLNTEMSFVGVYADIEDGHWYTPFVVAMGANGLTDTAVSGAYRPSDPMLRSEMAVFLQKAFKLASSGDPSTSTFADVPPTASYAAAAEAILQASITRGCGVNPLRFCPDDIVRRDTMAAFLARGLRARNQAQALVLAPDRETLRTISLGEDLWTVWVCENTPATEDPVSYLNREVSGYFFWLSDGQYRLRFRYGTDPPPDVAHILANCESQEHNSRSPEGANLFVGGDLWTIGYGYVGIAGGGFDVKSGQFRRTVWMDKRAIYDTTGYTHEIGHTLGWPHNLREISATSSPPLHTGMDIMASRGQTVGTHAHNLFQTGWIEPENVEIHPGGTGAYTIAPPHSGTGIELLMLPLTSDRLISIGARVRDGFDRNITEEGVEIYQIALCHGLPGCKRVSLPPDAAGSDAVVLGVGDTWSASVDTLRDGKGAITELAATVTGRQGDSFTVTVDQKSAPRAYSSIGVGRHGVCGVWETGRVTCWDWRAGQSPPPGYFKSITVGRQACGLRPNGIIQCWGAYRDGSTPPPGAFAAISVNGYYGCGLRTDGTVECWGSDHNRNPINDRPTGEFTSISTGWSHACGVRSDQTVDCWGSNHSGEGSPPSGEFRSAKAGGFFTCGLQADSTISCWGSADGDRTTPPAGGFTQLDAGWDHACAIRDDGSAACWGRNDYGQSSPPQGVFTAISVGDTRTCGLRLDHSVDCWGRKP